MSRETVRRAICLGEDDNIVEQRLRQARAEGAAVMAEEARCIVDSVSENRDAIAKAKLRADIRTWIASKWNREQYGEAKQSAVQITVQQLHLEALRQRAPSPEKMPRIPTAAARVIEIQDNETSTGEPA
jgi:hypothetical protein